MESHAPNTYHKETTKPNLAEVDGLGVSERVVEGCEDKLREGVVALLVVKCCILVHRLVQASAHIHIQTTR